MFSSTGLFRSIICPEGGRCRIPNCIFSHPKVVKADEPQELVAPIATNTTVEPTRGVDSSMRKRRRLDDDAFTVSQVNMNVLSPPTTAFTGALNAHNPRKLGTESLGAANTSPGAQDLRSVKKQVSPPPPRANKRGRLQTEHAGEKRPVVETLNPRLVPNTPVGHGTRLVYLVKLHELMAALNDKLCKSEDPEDTALCVTHADLIKMSLDEEEKLARGNPQVYSNLIRLRMVAYKKMQPDEWRLHRRQQIASNSTIPQVPTDPSPTPVLDTGLSPADELLFLPSLVTKQDGLDRHGYITSPPTPAEIASARAGVETSANWEACDRCQTRFQVFPDRREDGALTSGGKCTYHHGKRIRPTREKADAIKGHKESTWDCCNEPVGTAGCTVAETHVFKISDPKRLAAVMPFEWTPENPVLEALPIGDSRRPGAVTFDCEMCYTVRGFELVRLTAVAWPTGVPIIDVLVRPLGAVIDLNSRFSGVFPEQLAGALPHIFDAPSPPLATASPPPPALAPYGNPSGTITPPAPLRIVESPQAARNLLWSFLTPSTPLIGHAIENDLNIIRICHPTIIDTIILYPSPRGPLPMRLGLRVLTKRELDRDIQTGGAAGHSSLEDARATGDLVRLRIGRDWKRMKVEGWTITDGRLCGPQTNDSKGTVAGEAQHSRKRSRTLRFATDGAGDDDTASETEEDKKERGATEGGLQARKC
ncbi:hypothetical protein B0A49_06938 [Cryomyces minteri]|uniref:Exonuclease domain-containing protein n=1 Tax=Cryomyces minteri TaxID=331657 RepID=A0A4U0X5B9_9PEZI|nr:hypothetical protein B0A49_06938 [Cryomyces minteri]